MASATAATLILSLYASQAMAWTSTRYFSPIKDPILGTPTFYTVFPTGSVSATSSEIVSEQVHASLGDEYITIDVTITQIYLASGSASACTFGPCESTSTSHEAIYTAIFAPLIVTNPASCTLTSYSYTTSEGGALGGWGINPDIWSQVTDTGPAGPAMTVSTYVVTVSHNLGGQAVTAKRCDVFLKPGQVRGLTVSPAARQLMTECVDPRGYLCPSTSWMARTNPTCGTDWIGVYGQGAQTAPSGGQATAGAPAKPNGAWGRQGMAPRWAILAAGAVALVFCGV